MVNYTIVKVYDVPVPQMQLVAQSSIGTQFCPEHAMMAVDLSVSVSHVRNVVRENLNRNTNCDLLTLDDDRRWFEDPLTTFGVLSEDEIECLDRIRDSSNFYATDEELWQLATDVNGARLTSVESIGLRRAFGSPSTQPPQGYSVAWLNEPWLQYSSPSLPGYQLGYVCALYAPSRLVFRWHNALVDSHMLIDIMSTGQKKVSSRQGDNQHPYSLETRAEA